MKNPLSTPLLLVTAATAFVAAPVVGNTQVFATQADGETSVKIEFPEDQQLHMILDQDGQLIDLQIHVQKGKAPSQAVATISKLLLGKGLGYGQKTDQVIGKDVTVNVPLTALTLMSPTLGQIAAVFTDPKLNIVADTDMFDQIEHILTAARSQTGVVTKTKAKKLADA